MDVPPTKHSNLELPIYAMGGRFRGRGLQQVDIAFLKIEEKRFYLPRVASESGKKYSDGGTTLWLKGQSGSVETEGRSEFENCPVKPK